MDQIPVELIEKILSHENITIQDVCNFSASCKFFRQLVLNSSAIWKQKFRHKWPRFVPLFDNCYSNFFDEVQYIYNLKNRVLRLLEQMPQRFYKRYQLSETDFEQWSDLVKEKEQTYHYLIMILMDIINTSECIKSIETVPLNTPGNKTLQYYASKALRFIKQQHLSAVWQQYILLPLKQQTLEKGAIFVAQWCQTDLDITQENVQTDLDFIANLVKQRVTDINPEHQLLKAPQSQLDAWKHENLDQSQWSIAECRQIIVAMRGVIYTELGFCGNSYNYFMSENSLINKVLERRTGLPILLAIIYESVGRRLGVLFEPINFPAHFLLRFTESVGINPTVYYIDTFNGGDVVQKLACPYSNPTSRRALLPVATAIQVVERMVNNLELSTRQHIEPNGRATFLRAILELLVLVSPQDLSAILSLAKLYNLHKVNTQPLEDYVVALKFETPGPVEGILETLRGFSKQDLEDELDLHTDDPVVERPPEVKYAVGMVMTDITQNDKCVIFGWSAGCPAASECQEPRQWPRGAGAGQRQVIYNVLVEDGSYRYAEQDMLSPSSDPGSLESNKDLGRHFSHFFENHFVPNAEKEKQYRYDTRVRQKFYHEMLLTHYKP